MPSVPTAAKEDLLTACVAKQPLRLTHQQQAYATVLDWHAVPATVGSFAY